MRDVSFSVANGEILGLIGPNGSGKSTLFNCILGQLMPNNGAVTIKGQQVAGKRANELAKMGVGRTFQQLSVFPKMSVIDNIILAGQEHSGTLLTRLFGKPDAGLTETADRLIAFFRLTHLRDEMAGSLSYGQQSRTWTCGSLGQSAEDDDQDERHHYGDWPRGSLKAYR